MSKNIAHIGLQ